MGLAATTRRFANQCVELVRGSGYFDTGRFIAGPDEVTEFRANVQPAPPEVIRRLPEGSRSDGAKVIFPGPGAPVLRTAKAGDDGHNADRVRIDGELYEIATVEPWRQHFRYTALRFGQ